MILYNNVFSGKSSMETVKITHAELLNLVHNSQLDTNAIYQLTDFVDAGFKTDITDVITIEVLDNYFDLLLKPISSDMLSPFAGATRHEGTDYFSETELAAYQIEYYIEKTAMPLMYQHVSNYNVIYKLKDNEEQKGYIVQLIDYFNNRVNFNFKNIKINGRYLFDTPTGYEFVDGSSFLDVASNKKQSLNNTITINFHDNISSRYTFGAMMINCYIRNSFIGGHKFVDAKIMDSVIYGMVPTDVRSQSGLYITNSTIRNAIFKGTVLYPSLVQKIEHSTIISSNKLVYAPATKNLYNCHIYQTKDLGIMSSISDLYNTTINDVSTYIQEDSTSRTHQTWIQTEENVTKIVSV